MNATCPLNRLRADYPWPSARPGVRPIEWSLDAGGKHLVIEQIRRRRATLVLEIGSFLGASVRTWLAASPDVVVIALDPWPDIRRWLPELNQKGTQPAWAIEQLATGEDAAYHTFLANLWDERQRVIPMRDAAPAALYNLQKLGVQPELIYLDADKTGAELEVCRELFP
ncbi:MAG TPA: hypothetical protein VFV87_11995, partial [Pirellulaceae bacterium]|nr:hypothetical protein [Pirellulaceae bacterium]